jgi:hypothetical protein
MNEELKNKITEMIQGRGVEKIVEQFRYDVEDFLAEELNLDMEDENILDCIYEELNREYFTNKEEK